MQPSLFFCCLRLVQTGLQRGFHFYSAGEAIVGLMLNRLENDRLQCGREFGVEAARWVEKRKT